MQIPNFHRNFSVRCRLSWAACLFSVLAFAHPALAQDNGSGAATPGWPLHSSAPTHGLPDALGGPPAPLTVEWDEACVLWSVAPPQSGTIKASTLQIPGKARDEFKKGCADLRGKKLATAENHLRKAVEIYPKYMAAWVLLGQVLAVGEHLPEARDACTKASKADEEYALAYLCLADVAGQLREWNESQEFADRALKLEPDQGVYGHFYCAIAQVHLNQFQAAERNALEAIEGDKRHRVPQTHLLLAQIYGAKRDYQHAAEQLRTYLTVFPTAPDAPGVKKSLSDLEARIAAASEQSRN